MRLKLDENLGRRGADLLLDKLFRLLKEVRQKLAEEHDVPYVELGAVS